MNNKLEPVNEKMMNVKCKCGHFERVWRGRDEEATIKKWARMLCKNCYNIEKNKTAMELLVDNELLGENKEFKAFTDIMVGSEKQINYAKNILDRWINSTAWGYLRKDLKDFIIGHSDAKWFIDNKDKDLYELLKSEGKIRNINEFFKEGTDYGQGQN